MDLSLFLAKVLGLYLIIVIAACVVQWRGMKKVLEDFERSRGLIVFSGAWALLLGLLLVTSHNIWEWNFRGVITFLGWVTLLKGLLRLFFPQNIGKIARKVLWTPFYTMILGMFFLLGVWLTVVGFAVHLPLP